ncbi:tetraspanin-5 isoform X4 [Parus major]|uniref:tetraspanin-5 isoform X4 n=1 Tax=Parus major TaxID=9157 RepID=UPI00144475B7|nr:tetraspanin-5 isoform X4 [Parus major]
MSLQCHVIGVFQTGAQNLEMVAFQSSGSSQFLGIAFLGIGLWAWNEKFSVFLGIIFFLELTAGVLAFVFKDWIKDQLYFFINNNIRAYRDDIDLQNLIDFTQEYWQCCGAFGADDWNLNIYFNCTDSNASRERCGVPFSCCTKDPAEDVINTQCGYDARQKPEVDQQIVIYTKGCVPQFEKWLQDNLTIVAGIFIGIALLQIFGICLAQNLVSDIEAVRASW